MAWLDDPRLAHSGAIRSRRQLDGVPGTLSVLPEVVDAADGRLEVLFDGGIRRGSDIAKAMCLGARALLVGRAYVYGLGAAGGFGVARAIEILRTDVVRTLKLLGCASLSDLDQSNVQSPEEWGRAVAPRVTSIRASA